LASTLVLKIRNTAIIAPIKNVPSGRSATANEDTGINWVMRNPHPSPLPRERVYLSPLALWERGGG